MPTEGHEVVRAIKDRTGPLFSRRDLRELQTPATTHQGLGLAAQAAGDETITLDGSTEQLADAALIHDLARRTVLRHSAALDKRQRAAAARLLDRELVEHRQSRVVLTPKAAYGAYFPKTRH